MMNNNENVHHSSFIIHRSSSLTLRALIIVQECHGAQAIESVFDIGNFVPQAGAETARRHLQAHDKAADCIKVQALPAAELVHGPDAGESGEQISQRDAVIGAESAL